MARVDAEGRIVLPVATPGDVYEIQTQPDGTMRLIRLGNFELPKRMTSEEVIEAIKRSPLGPTMSWEELRKITREL